MTRSRALSLLATGMLVAGGASAHAQSAPKDLVTAGLAAVFVDFDSDAVRERFAKDYIQHNPAIPTGVAPLIDLLPALKESGIKIKIHRILAEGDMVVTHNTFENARLLGADKVVTFDVFRTEDGRIAEHWDNIAPIAPPNPSGRTQVDGPTEITDLDRTQENKALVAEFVDAVLVRGELDRLPELFDGDVYLQHNSNIADGLNGLDMALKAMAKQGVTMRYDRVNMSIGEGNFVLVMSEGTFADKPTAFFDLFRVENGRIAEHWDVISEIPAQMAHDNGKF